MSAQPLSDSTDATRCRSPNANCPGAPGRRAGRFGSNGAAARSPIVMNGLSAALRHDEPHLRIRPCRMPQIREGTNRIVEEHHTEARHDQVDARGPERVVCTSARTKRARTPLRAARLRGVDHPGRDIDARALHVRPEPPRDRERDRARAAADVEHAARGRRGRPHPRATFPAARTSGRSAPACRPTRARRAVPSADCSSLGWLVSIVDSPSGSLIVPRTMLLQAGLRSSPGPCSSALSRPVFHISYIRAAYR